MFNILDFIGVLKVNFVFTLRKKKQFQIKINDARVNIIPIEINNSLIELITKYPKFTFLSISNKSRINDNKINARIRFMRIVLICVDLVLGVFILAIHNGKFGNQNKANTILFILSLIIFFGMTLFIILKFEKKIFRELFNN